MRFILVLVLGAIIGFGAALWFQGEPPFAGQPSGSRGDITILLSDRYLTRLAGPTIAGRSDGLLSGVHIASASGDVMYVRASAHFGGAVVPGGVSLTLTAAAGTLRLNVRSAHVGPVPVPGVIASPLLAAINSKVTELAASGGFVITGAGTTQTAAEVFLRPG